MKLQGMIPWLMTAYRYKVAGHWQRFAYGFVWFMLSWAVQQMAVELGVMKPILIADIIDSEGQGTYHIRVSLTSRVTVTQRWFEGMSDVAGQISNSMSMTSCFFFIG